MTAETGRQRSSHARCEIGHTARKQEERRASRYNNILQGINRIFEQVIRAETDEVLGNTCLDVALELTGSRIGFIGEVGTDGLLHDIAISDTGWDQCRMHDQSGHRRPPGDFVLHGLYGQVIHDRKGFFTNNPSSHPDSTGVPRGHPLLRNFLGVPLVHQGKLIGVLAVANREDGYDCEQQEDLQALAPAVVEALVRKRAEEALRESEGRFQAAIKSSTLVLAQTDRELRYRWIANPHPDFDATSVIGKRDDELDDTEGAKHLMALKQQVLDSAVGVREEVRFDRSDGVHVYDMTIEPLRSPAGDIVGVTTAAIDISARVQAEEALRQSEARRKVAEAVEVERRRFNDMLDILPAYVVLLSPDHHVPFANRFFRERFGESRGQRCYEYLFGRTEPCESCESYKALETNAPHHWEWTGPDERLYDVYDFPFTDVDGSPLIMEMGIDITERKQAEEALIQAERLTIMGRMTASLAHEVNNPIQSVVGCLGLAQELLEEGEDATPFIEVALEESERAARIVHRMRDLGRSEAAQKEFADVGELIGKVLILTRNQAQNQHVEVTWKGAKELPPVPMVRDRIQQVFLNLVLNAIDAMPEGGELHIWATRTTRPSGVEVCFADTGIGIAPEHVKHMFEAFHSTKQLGLGLGLYVSRNIVQEHDGWIDVQSEVGTGTTFTVWLPAGSG